MGGQRRSQGHNKERRRSDKNKGDDRAEVDKGDKTQVNSIRAGNNKKRETTGSKTQGGQDFQIKTGIT